MIWILSNAATDSTGTSVVKAVLWTKPFQQHTCTTRFALSCESVCALLFKSSRPCHCGEQLTVCSSTAVPPGQFSEMIADVQRRLLRVCTSCVLAVLVHQCALKRINIHACCCATCCQQVPYITPCNLQQGSCQPSAPAIILQSYLTANTPLTAESKASSSPAHG